MIHYHFLCMEWVRSQDPPRDVVPDVSGIGDFKCHYLLFSFHFCLFLCVGIFYFRILSFFPRRIGSLFEIWEKMKKFDSESEKKQKNVFL